MQQSECVHASSRLNHEPLDSLALSLQKRHGVLQADPLKSMWQQIESQSSMFHLRLHQRAAAVRRQPSDLGHIGGEHQHLDTL